MTLEQIAVEHRTLASIAGFMRTYGIDLNKDYGLEYMDRCKRLEQLLGKDEEKPELKEVPHRIGRNFSKRTPNSVRGLEKLGEMGIHFPVNLESDKFKVLNILAAYVFFSGWIDKKFKLSIHAHPAQGYYSVDRLVETFGFKSDLIAKDLFAGSEGGLSLARLLYVMGIPKSEAEGTALKGTKTLLGISLPKYIMTLYDGTKEKPDETRLAYEALLDFANVMMLTKARINSGGFELRLNQQRDRRNAEDLGEQTFSLLTLLFPGIKFRCKPAKKTTRGCYLPGFALSTKQTEKFIEYYSGLVPFGAMIKDNSFTQLYQCSLNRNLYIAQMMMERITLPP